MIIARAKLIELLQETIVAIENDDSYEGRVMYQGTSPGEYEVDAFVRVGTSEGQGGCMLVQPSVEGQPCRAEMPYPELKCVLRAGHEGPHR